MLHETGHPRPFAAPRYHVHLIPSETLRSHLVRPRIELETDAVFPSNPTHLYPKMRPSSSLISKTTNLQKFVFAVVRNPNAQADDFHHLFPFTHEGKRYFPKLELYMTEMAKPVIIVASSSRSIKYFQYKF